VSAATHLAAGGAGHAIGRNLVLHAAVVLALAALWAVLPLYHQGALARILVLAVFAMGYNLAFGYTGMLSLGHAMFFAAGLYAAGLGAQFGGWAAAPAFLAGLLAGGALALAVGLLALRTAGVAFMIVTLMFAQAAHLTVLYFTEITRGDEGFTLPAESRTVLGLSLAEADARFWTAWALFAVALAGVLWLTQTRLGRAMVALRENEPRARMLGYDPFRIKLLALILSGGLAGAAGAAYALLFGSVGATFASVEYSILPLLYVLLGGAGTVLGPLIGALVMFYLIDWASGVTDAYLLAVGAALVALVLFAPQGILGLVRARWARWLA